MATPRATASAGPGPNMVASWSMASRAPSPQSKRNVGQDVLLQAMGLSQRALAQKRLQRKQKTSLMKASGKRPVAASSSKRLAADLRTKEPFNAKDYPNGRISRILLKHADSDWLTEVANREYFRRLAGIGALKRAESTDSSAAIDVVAQQVRDEEEEEALECIRRCRRNGDITLDHDEIKMLEARFSRIGKAKSASGAAYRAMTESIASGQARKKNRGDTAKPTAFKPPTVLYNPFALQLLLDPSLRAPCAQRAPSDPRISSVSSFRVVVDALQALNTSPRELGPMPTIRPPSADSQVSDWTDCDEEEFGTMMIKMSAPAHDMVDWRVKTGSAEALRHGHYRSPDVDTELVWDRLVDLEPRIAEIRQRQEPAFDASEMDLPQNLVRDLLLPKYEATVERLGVPIYSSVGWKRASDEMEVLRPPPEDDSWQFIKDKNRQQR